MRIGKTTSVKLITCISEVADDLRHTFQCCATFQEKRTRLASQLGLSEPFKCEDLAKSLMEDKKSWRLIADFTDEIMQFKNNAQRRQAGAPQGG